MDPLVVEGVLKVKASRTAALEGLKRHIIRLFEPMSEVLTLQAVVHYSNVDNGGYATQSFYIQAESKVTDFDQLEQALHEHLNLSVFPSKLKISCTEYGVNPKKV